VTEDHIDWVHAYLERDDEIIVPIKKMWNEWRMDNAGPTLDEFSAQLLADERFEEMGGVDHNEGMDWMAPEELDEHEREMEELGYFSGPRVKLRSREVTLDHIAKMIKKHNDRMEDALQQARESMPADIDEQEEGQLIDVLEMVKQWREMLREAGLEGEQDESGNEGPLLPPA
jgi:hypothetical protein